MHTQSPIFMPNQSYKIYYLSVTLLSLLLILIYPGDDNAAIFLIFYPLVTYPVFFVWFYNQFISLSNYMNINHYFLFKKHQYYFGNLGFKKEMISPIAIFKNEIKLHEDLVLREQAKICRELFYLIILAILTFLLLIEILIK